ncbi:unnamed protein product [Mycena citricolor]|uniref:Uncharacterized protein n=1 Tax=Mycena citricolor TaxID=2018698 RepID=A0AAD2HJV9_9AGAR|nr:unnamed protein product [Mycena citricolor]
MRILAICAVFYLSELLRTKHLNSLPHLHLHPPLMSVHTFQPPRLAVQLSLGHKFQHWFLLFSHDYRTADSREVARLSAPHPPPPGAKSPGSRPLRPRFWFDPHAASGWERDGESLLDVLLSLDLREPPILAVVEEQTGMRSVEVLVPEERLCRFCEGCERWEVLHSAEWRWFRVRDGPLPSYLCPSCTERTGLGLVRRGAGGAYGIRSPNLVTV